MSASIHRVVCVPTNNVLNVFHHILLFFSLSSSTQVDSKHQPSGMLSVAVLYVQCVYVDVHVHENYRSQVDHICRSVGVSIQSDFSRLSGIPVIEVLWCSWSHLLLIYCGQDECVPLYRKT